MSVAESTTLPVVYGDRECFRLRCADVLVISGEQQDEQLNLISVIKVRVGVPVASGRDRVRF
jgi:hypothetical protein